MIEIPIFILWRTKMGLLEAFEGLLYDEEGPVLKSLRSNLTKVFEELCETEGPLGEMATKIGDELFECGHSIADSLDDFAEKLGNIEKELRAEDGTNETDDPVEELVKEAGTWAEDRLDPEFEKTPGLIALRNAVDSIVDICEGMADKINEATMSIMEKTGA
jgi:hypothetical protein